MNRMNLLSCNDRHLRNRHENVTALQQIGLAYEQQHRLKLPREKIMNWLQSCALRDLILLKYQAGAALGEAVHDTGEVSNEHCGRLACAGL